MVTARAREAVVGATDVAATTAFFSVLGFRETARAPLPPEAAAALYGLDGDAEQVTLSAPRAEVGGVRVVATPHPAAKPGPFDRRPYGLDIYTGNAAAAVAAVVGAGFSASAIAAYDLGAQRPQEVRLVGPDDLGCFAIQTATRRASLLDREPTRLLSELMNVVYLVDDADAAAAVWVGALGLAPLLAVDFRAGALAGAMRLPRDDVALRLVMVGTADGEPMRLGLLGCPQDPGPALPPWPLRGGIWGLALAVDDLDAAVAEVPGAQPGPVVDTPAGRAVSLAAPGPVRVELWERRDG